MKKAVGILVLSFCLLAAVAGCGTANTAAPEGEANASGAYPAMYDVNFWLERLENGGEILLTAEELAALSQQIRESGETANVDLPAYSATLDRAALTALVEQYTVPKEERFQGAEPVTADYYDELLAARNLDNVADENEVGWGVIVRETQVRTFPTADVSYTEPNDLEFDMFCETVLKVWEPVAVLHTSVEGDWLYVQSSSYLGWVAARDVARTERSVWQDYAARDFLTVTGGWLRLDADPADPALDELKMSMGTRLPLAASTESVANVSTESSYAVLLPACDGNGKLAVKTARVSRSADVTAGYLPYTRATIVRQAFKLLGERYGWGGMLSARDCSSYIRDCYLTVGLELPRNGNDQAAIPARRLELAELTETEKEAAICGLSPGSILRLPGHVALYLGCVDGRAYIIHDAYAYGPSGLGGAEGRMTVNCVNVSDLYITRKDGSTFLAAIEAAVSVLPAQ